MQPKLHTQIQLKYANKILRNGTRIIAFHCEVTDRPTTLPTDRKLLVVKKAITPGRCRETQQDGYYEFFSPETTKMNQFRPRCRGEC